MKYASLKSHLAAFGAVAALATQAHAQSSLINISASGIYQGGNTAIGGMPFTNGAPFTEYFSLLVPQAGLASTTFPTNSYMSAYEVMDIGGVSYTNTESSITLNYHNGGDVTAGNVVLGLQAGTDDSAFGFNIRLNGNPFGASSGSLTLTELGAVLTDFQSNTSINWSGTYIYANANDVSSTIGNVAPVPEPSTLALAAFGGAGAWTLLRRRRK